jgi:hypothetical protein
MVEAQGQIVERCLELAVAIAGKGSDRSAFAQRIQSLNGVAFASANLRFLRCDYSQRIQSLNGVAFAGFCKNGPSCIS